MGRKGYAALGRKYRSLLTEKLRRHRSFLRISSDLLQPESPLSCSSLFRIAVLLSFLYIWTQAKTEMWFWNHSIIRTENRFAICVGTTKTLKNTAVQSNISRRLKTRQFSIAQPEFRSCFQIFHSLACGDPYTGSSASPKFEQPTLFKASNATILKR